MKISVDGGALNPKNNQRFGTSVFSVNLVAALKLYDKKNQYFIYTFKNLKPKLFWLKARVSLEELKQKKDIFLALNQAIPLYTSGKIITFCHGLSYYFHPQLYPKKDVVRLKKQLDEMLKRSDKIIVSSEKVKDELVLVRQSLDEGGLIIDKIHIEPFGIPLDMLDTVTTLIRPYKSCNRKYKYFLFVANNQKIKNLNFVINSFIKSSLNKTGYKLFLVGDWKEYENKNKGIISIGNATRQKLKKLYQRAIALLTSSYYESFNFPVLEALSQGCPVIGLPAAIIPEFLPYVNLANNVEEFVEKMKKITKKLDVQSINRLYTQFNWQNYVKNLVKLY